jgi:hypothetical protein
MCKTYVKKGEYIEMDVTDVTFIYVDWIHLAQDSDQCWAAVNTAMNHCCPQNAVNYSLAEELKVSRRNLCSTDLYSS